MTRQERRKRRRQRRRRMQAGILLSLVLVLGLIGNHYFCKIF